MIWRLRSILFNIAFYGTSLFLLTACIPLWLAPRSWQRRVPPIWLTAVRWTERYILGLTYEVIGQENLPPAPYIVAMKHQSAWETMKLYELFGNPAIVLKKELMDLPLWGQYAKAMDMVPVDRTKGHEATQYMVESARQVLVDKRPLVIFPQGTRVAVGARKSYKLGVSKVYESLNIPVVPVAHNAGVFWPRNAFWKRPGKITITILPPIPPGQDAPKVLKQIEASVEAESNRLCAQAIAEHGLQKEFPLMTDGSGAQNV
jgi:1-acyl-sn-glycerol-3-phosphate acyltransferase